MAIGWPQTFPRPDLAPDAVSRQRGAESGDSDSKHSRLMRELRRFTVAKACAKGTKLVPKPDHASIRAVLSRSCRIGSIDPALACIVFPYV